MIAAPIATPKVDWLALSPTLALLVAAAVCLLGAVLVPRAGRRIFSAVIAGSGFLVAGVLAAVVFGAGAPCPDDPRCLRIDLQPLGSGRWSEFTRESSPEWR